LRELGEEDRGEETGDGRAREGERQRGRAAARPGGGNGVEAAAALLEPGVGG